MYKNKVIHQSFKTMSFPHTRLQFNGRSTGFAGSPAAPPSPCSILTSQQMFDILNNTIYAGCTNDQQNPICVAVHQAAASPNPTLKTLADQLYKIKESDLITYLQGAGASQAQVIYSTLLQFLKCYLSPSSSDDKKTVQDEMNSIAAIKDWYLQNYLYAFGKATIPGVNFSRKDADAIRANLNRATCKNEDVYMWIVFWSVISGVVMIIIGFLIGHSKGKKSCLKHIANIATRQ